MNPHRILAHTDDNPWLHEYEGLMRGQRGVSLNCSHAPLESFTRDDFVTVFRLIGLLFQSIEYESWFFADPEGNLHGFVFSDVARSFVIETAQRSSSVQEFCVNLTINSPEELMRDPNA